MSAPDFVHPAPARGDPCAVPALVTQPAATNPPLDAVDLVRQHQVGLWRYLRVLGAQPAEAEDFAQEALLTALRHPPRERAPAALAAYLRSVARNLFLKGRRRAQRAPQLLDPQRIDDAALDDCFAARCGDDGGEAYLAALRGCVDLLDARAKAALRRHYEERAGRQALARDFGLGKDGVKSWLRRIRSELRACVQRKLGGAEVSS